MEHGLPVTDQVCYRRGPPPQRKLRPLIFKADALDGFYSLKLIQLPLHGAARQAKEARKLIRREQLPFSLTNQHRSPDQISFEGRTKARSPR